MLIPAVAMLKRQYYSTPEIFTKDELIRPAGQEIFSKDAQIPGQGKTDDEDQQLKILTNFCGNIGTAVR